MKRIWCCLALAAGVAAAAWLDPRDARAQDKKGTVVEFGDLKSKAPPTWVEEPAGQMRFAQFKLPKAAGDPRDAEVVIFKGIGGSTKDNVDRWKKMFKPPDGKSIDDVAKVSEMKIGNAEVTYLDVRGTYQVRKQPFNPNSPSESLPNYRMVAVEFRIKEAPYHIRLVGPAKTVEEYKNGFDEWLKAFK